MKGGNKTSRREEAIERRLKNLIEYSEQKNTDKARKAFKDIACTCGNLQKDIPSEARMCLTKLGIKEEDVFVSKTKIPEITPAELPEEVLGVSQE
jgi:hypothetical protein